VQGLSDYISRLEFESATSKLLSSSSPRARRIQTKHIKGFSFELHHLQQWNCLFLTIVHNTTVFSLLLVAITHPIPVFSPPPAHSTISSIPTATGFDFPLSITNERSFLHPPYSPLRLELEKPAPSLERIAYGSSPLPRADQQLQYCRAVACSCLLSQ